MTTNISDLNLEPESVPEISWDAPESGSFPPAVEIGAHDFAFALADDPFEAKEIKGRKCLQVTYSATAVNGTGEEHTLNFQRVTTYQSDKMKASGLNHMAGELLRSLGVRIEGQLSPQRIADALNEATAQRKHFPGVVAWRRYCKDCNITVSTHPNKKNGEIDWPRGADGKPELAVACPGCKVKGYGNAEIIRFKLPEGGASTVASTTSTSGVNI